MVEGLLNNYKILMTFVTVIVAPVVEELVLRYSFSTFIKNKWVFLAVTSILFGALHALNLNIIIYIYIGLMLGLIYLNTDKKIACPILVHLINNLASVAMLFLGL